MKTYPLEKLIQDWTEINNSINKELRILSNKRKKEALHLIQRRLRLSFFAFFSPYKKEICIWKNGCLEIKTEKLNFRVPALSEDESMYQTMITRMLVADVWGITEGLIRRTIPHQKAYKILIKIFGKDRIPDAINVLRLLRNLYHNNGIHTDPNIQDKIFTIRGWKFRFSLNKPTNNFALPAILQLIDQVIIDIIHSPNL